MFTHATHSKSATIPFVSVLLAVWLIGCSAPPTLIPVPPTPTPLPPSPTLPPTATLTTVAASPTSALNPLSLDERNRVFEQVWTLVRDQWVYNNDFHGLDWQQVHAEFVPRVASADNSEAFYTLMRELVQKLGDRSSFSSPQELANATALSATTFGGIGATLTAVPEGQVVLSTVRGAPAELAGLAIGDIVQSVDGVAVTKLEASTPGGTISAIRGRIGTVVHLVVLSPDGKSRSLDITRAEITAAPVIAAQAVRLTGTQVALLTITTFNPADTQTQIKSLLQNLSQAAPLEGLIIDVRHSSGGLSNNPMLATLALFMDGGSIGTYGVDKAPTPINIARGATIPEFKNLPIVVVTSGTAVSGPEVFASGMQVLKRARIVGMPTAGATGLFRVNELADGSQLKIVTQIYRRPNGTTIEGAGVQPDRVVDGKWYLYPANPGDDPQLKAALEELKKK